MAEEHELIKGVEYYLDNSKKNTGFFDHLNEHSVYFKRGKGEGYLENVEKLISFFIDGFNYKEVEK